MSDPTSRMPSDDDAHPSALLAAYADGTASEQDREAAEAHLAGCAGCRDDLEFARAALAAVRSLPELEAPGLAREGLAALGVQSAEEPPSRSGVFSFDRASRQRRPSVAQLLWGTGVAAVLAVAAVFVFSALHGGGSATSATKGGPAAAPTVAAAPPVAMIASNTNYSADSVGALAQRLSAEKRLALASGASGTQAPSAPRASAGEDEATFASNSSAAIGALACLRRGGEAGGTTVYLEQAGYQGTPASIGGFLLPAVNGGRPHLLVFVVSRDGCQFLYEVRQAG